MATIGGRRSTRLTSILAHVRPGDTNTLASPRSVSTASAATKHVEPICTYAGDHVCDRGDPGKLLSTRDWEFWEREGYLVVPDAVPPAVVETCKREIFERMGASPDRPDSWYAAAAVGRTAQAISSQGQWDCRSAPRVYQTFAELWGKRQLWVSFDGVGVRLPDKPGYDGGDGFMHWDLREEHLRAGADPATGGCMRVQGVIMLADTLEHGGTFQCIPGFHRALPEWLAGMDSEALCRGGDMPVVPMESPTETALPGFEVRRVGGKAGTLIVWNSFLPHGNSRNTSDSPRLCCYVTMFPPESPSLFKGWRTNWSDEVERQRRVKIWELGLHLRPQDAQWNHEQPLALPQGMTDMRGEHSLQREQPATLSPLGQRLLGLQDWGHG